MVIGIFGESCVGKSTLAETIKQRIHAHIYTGKDYLRLAKNEAIAKKLFAKQLQEAVNGDSIIYVISEKEDLSLLPDDAIRILVTADLEVIKARFSARMHGNLPIPVEKMLEKKHGCFNNERHDIHIEAGKEDECTICDHIAKIINTQL